MHSWRGRHMILDSSHESELEARTAVHELSDGMAPHAAEQKAHEGYLRQHMQRAAAHHLAGIRASHSVGNEEESSNHHLYYSLFAKTLGFDPHGDPPPEIAALAKDPTQTPITKFVSHPADAVVLEHLRRQEMTKSETDVPNLGIQIPIVGIQTPTGIDMSHCLPKARQDNNEHLFVLEHGNGPRTAHHVRQEGNRRIPLGMFADHEGTISTVMAKSEDDVLAAADLALRIRRGVELASMLEPLRRAAAGVDLIRSELTKSTLHELHRELSQPPNHPEHPTGNGGRGKNPTPYTGGWDGKHVGHPQEWLKGVVDRFKGKSEDLEKARNKPVDPHQRIRDLIALGTKNPNPHEGASANAMAQKLMAQHPDVYQGGKPKPKSNDAWAHVNWGVSQKDKAARTKPERGWAASVGYPQSKPAPKAKPATTGGANVKGGMFSGETIGNTRSGKPVYQNFGPKNYNDFTWQDHKDASSIHYSHPRKIPNVSHEEETKHYKISDRHADIGQAMSMEENERKNRAQNPVGKNEDLGKAGQRRKTVEIKPLEPVAAPHVGEQTVGEYVSSNKAKTPAPFAFHPKISSPSTRRATVAVPTLAGMKMTENMSKGARVYGGSFPGEIKIPSDNHPARPQYDSDYHTAVTQHFGSMKPIKVRVRDLMPRNQPANTQRLNLYSKMIANGDTVPPIVVSRQGNSHKYDIVDGSHRYAAAQAAGISDLPAMLLPPRR